MKNENTSETINLRKEEETLIEMTSLKEDREMISLREVNTSLETTNPEMTSSHEENIKREKIERRRMTMSMIGHEGQK